MLGDSRAYSSFSSNDMTKSREFYAQTLGLEVTEANGMLTVHFAGGGRHLIYPKDDHQAAPFTVLNFPVKDVEAVVDQLTTAGVTFERYEGANQDERGIMRDMGSSIAWFKDPGGNILAVLEG